MFVRKFSIKMIVVVFVVLCMAIFVVVFNRGRDKAPVESAKTEHQLREQVIGDHLESKGRPRVERGNTESLTADLQVFVLDPNTPPPSDMPKDAIIVTSPEDINSAVTNYINHQKPEKTVTRPNIADILESRRSGSSNTNTQRSKIMSNNRLNRIIQQGVEDNVFVIPEPIEQPAKGPITSSAGFNPGNFPAASSSQIPIRINPFPSRAAKNLYNSPSAIKSSSVIPRTSISLNFSMAGESVSIKPMPPVDLNIERSEGSKEPPLLIPPGDKPIEELIKAAN